MMLFQCNYSVITHISALSVYYRFFKDFLMISVGMINYNLKGVM